MKIVGIDHSRTETVLLCADETLRVVDLQIIRLPARIKGFERTVAIAAEAQAFVQRHHPHYVGIEGYAMNVHSKVIGRLADMGELGGCIKLRLWDIGYGEVKGNLFVIPPSNHKKFSVEKGNATKEEMVVGISQDERFPFAHDDDNVIDAYSIAITTLALVDAYPLPLTAKQTEALRKLRQTLPASERPQSPKVVGKG